MTKRQAAVNQAINRAETLLRDYPFKFDYDDNDVKLIEILTDIMHLADKRKVSFRTILRMANQEYQRETQ
jgi:hypothetical protein